MTFRMILIFILFIAVICMVIGLVREDNKCPEPRVIYRYVPRTFEEEQDEPVYVSDIFKLMFSDTSPWVASIETDRKKQEQINKFFISQI